MTYLNKDWIDTEFDKQIIKKFGSSKEAYQRGVKFAIQSYIDRVKNMSPEQLAKHREFILGTNNKDISLAEMRQRWGLV